MSFARRLDAITEWPNDRLAESAWRKQAVTTGFKNCYSAFGGVWQVKMYIHREQRLLGESKRGWQAARFADMAIVYFHKYRTRRTRPLLNSDLNFTLETANADLASVTPAVAMLQEFEAALVQAGLRVPENNRAIPARDARTFSQVRRDIGVSWLDVKSGLAHAHRLLGASPEVCNQFAVAQEFFDNTEKCLHSIDRLLDSAQHSPPTEPKGPATPSEQIMLDRESRAEQRAAVTAAKQEQSVQAALDSTADKCDYYGCIPENTEQPQQN